MSNLVGLTKACYNDPIPEVWAGRVVVFSLMLAMAVTAIIFIPSAFVIGMWLARQLAGVLL